MTVKIVVQNYPGLSEIVVDFGLGRRPRNTTDDEIVALLKKVPGLGQVGIGSLRSHEGVWGVSRRGPGRRTDLFTSAEVAKVKEVAERIANKG